MLKIKIWFAMQVIMTIPSVYAMKKQLEAAYERQQRKLQTFKILLTVTKARVATQEIWPCRVRRVDKMEIIEGCKQKKPKNLNSISEKAVRLDVYFFKPKDLVIGFDRPLTKAPLNLTFERNQR